MTAVGLVTGMAIAASANQKNDVATDGTTATTSPVMPGTGSRSATPSTTSPSNRGGRSNRQSPTTTQSQSDSGTIGGGAQPPTAQAPTQQARPKARSHAS